MNITINTKLFYIFPNITIAHIFNMLLFSTTQTYKQTHIAKQLGLTRMTVARSLKWLKTEGYIDYERYQNKEDITTKFILTDKALKIKEDILKENNHTEQQQEEKKETKNNLLITKYLQIIDIYN